MFNHKMLTYLFLVLCFFLIPLHTLTGQVKPNNYCKEIALLLSAGNAESLSSHFGEKVTVFIPKVNDHFSKAHARRIIKDFFEKNIPEKFIFLNNDSEKKCKDNLVGILKAESGDFYVYVYYKIVDNDFEILQIQLEQI